jgi:hypothetical protein
MEATETPLMDWHIVLQLVWFVLAGLLVHFLDKLDSAKKKDGFTWKEFWKQNLISYITATIVCVVGLAFLGNSIEMVSGTSKMVIAFAIGFGGGSLVRSFITKFLNKT